MRRYLPSFANLAVSLLFYPASLLLVSIYFTAEERGVYFSLTGFIVLQLLFDLGVVQASVTVLSREFVGTSIAENGEIIAERLRADRIRVVVFRVSRWLRRASYLALGVVGVLGAAVMIKSGVSYVIWLPAVATLMLGIASTLWVMPLQVVIEGANEVAALGSARTFGNLARIAVLTMGIAVHPSVAWLGLSIVVQALVFAWAVPRKFRRLLKISRSLRASEIETWESEVLPFQRKLAVTWIGGSVVILPLVPCFMIAFGPKAAGQFGLTVTVFQSAIAIAVLWQTVSLPRIAGLVVQEGSRAAVALWKKEFGRSLVTFGLLAIAFIGAVELSPLVQDVRARVVTPAEFGWLALGFLGTLVIYSCSYVVRAHKVEPFIFQYSLWAILSATGLIAAILLESRVGYCASFAIASTVGAIVVFLKFTKIRRLLGNTI